MRTTPSVDLLTDRLTAAITELDATGQRIGLTLLRLLALGDPVSPATVAERGALPESRVAAELQRWPGVFRDEHGDVIGYAGLTVREMGQHRIHMEGRALSTWCAYDTLFLPELLGQTVGVTSGSPASAQEISLTVGADGVRDLQPEEAVVSFLIPDTAFDDNVIQSFCHYVHFFGSEQDAAAWTSAHDETFTISVEDAFEVGRRVNRARFGQALDGLARVA
jgi:alkylmercury lyase